MRGKVGEVFVTMKVHGPSGSEEIQHVLVDTGAIHSVIEQTLAERLGIRPEARGLFNIVGGEIELPLATAVLEVEGRSFRVPVILGDQNLVGCTTLETLSFAVDPTIHRLVPKHGHLFSVAEPPMVPA